MRYQPPDAASDAEDLQLATLAKNGDELAFEALYKKHYAWVRSKAYDMLTCPLDTEDAVQDVFARLWQNLKKWDDTKGRFVGWFYTLATRCIMDNVRKRNRNREHLLEGTPDNPDVSMDTYATTAPAPTRNVEKEEARRRLEDAILLMTKPNHRIAWMLKNLEGYSYKDIYRILDRPPAQVKTWIRRGRLELQQILEKTEIQK